MSRSHVRVCCDPHPYRPNPKLEATFWSVLQSRVPLGVYLGPKKGDYPFGVLFTLSVLITPLAGPAVLAE